MTAKSVGPSGSGSSKGLVLAAAQSPPTGRIVAELDPAVGDEQELARLLDLSSRTAMGWLPAAADWAGMAVTFDGASFAGCEAAAGVMDLERTQQVACGGPGAQALRTGEIVAAGWVYALATWPQLCERAAAAGVRSFLAAPLINDGVVRGALTLYGRHEAGFVGFEADRLQVLVELVRGGLIEHSFVTAARTQVMQLRRAMACRAPIEQAKGILMALHGVDEDDAFDRLRVHSQRTNTKLREVATELVARASHPEPAT